MQILTENTREVRQGEVVLRLDGLQAEVVLQQAEAELAESVRVLVIVPLEQFWIKANFLEAQIAQIRSG